jgi:1D-myo-inositol 3-kinase
LSAIDYLIIGHVTQDRVDSKLVLGGTATYAGLAARNLGQRVALLTSAAFEPGLVDVLCDIQVARVPAEETTRYVNSYPKGEARQQHVEARAEPLDPTLLMPEWRAAGIVHLAPLANEIRPDAVDFFPEALVGVTPQGWMRAWDSAGLVRAVRWDGAERVLARADAVIISEKDVHERSEIDRLAGLAKLLVLTRGERGASCCRAGNWQHLPAFQSKRQVDPTGAGDVFAAAFFVHLKQSGDPELSAHFACCVASFAVEKRHHAAVPTLEQVEERWKQGKRRKKYGPE